MVFMNCLFCRIAAGEIPAQMVYEDADCLAFADISPQAPTHLLVIPREHIQSLEQATADHAPLLGALMRAAATVARQAGLAKGYRVVLNTGAEGGQTVDHLHLHVLGGRAMRWPPG
jgi:histidine triad (HIT) family protein